MRRVQSFPVPSGGNNERSMITSWKGYGDILTALCRKIDEGAYRKHIELFPHHITNARGEWINSKITLIEKMSFDYRNKEHLKTAIYFMCGNLELYP